MTFGVSFETVMDGNGHEACGYYAVFVPIINRSWYRTEYLT